MTHIDRTDEARALLSANDRGGFTLPTARLYPYQWNWDSAFVALGFAEFDLDRAWREIETLFDAQWDNGMVPHIIFRDDDPDYFPGPSVWVSGTEPPSSGHSQPPVAMTAVHDLYRRDPAIGAPRLRKLFPSLLAWHRWFHTQRDPDKTGLIVATHPWESGRDNSPDWDAAMAAIEPTGIAPYVRRDTGHVDPAMRPTKEEYDRFLYLVKWGVETGWDHERIVRDGPFRVADPGLTFILLRADRDLHAMAEILGETDAATEIAASVSRLEAGVDTLWSDQHAAYLARDMATGSFAPAVTNVSFLSFYAGLGDGDRAERLIDTFRRVARETRYVVPSYDVSAPGFDAQRYWRGPVWAVVNFMVGRGMAEQGYTAEADRVRHDTRHLIETSGFYEYFDPTNGGACGGSDFSWTAAVWLSWARSEG